MLDALLLVWGLLHALEDPVVIVACAAIGGACGAFTRRLDGAAWSNGFWPVIGNAAVGGVLTGITSAAAAFVGMELFPRYPKLVVGAILFSSGIVDTTTDTGRNWVQREVFGRLLALFDAARNGGRYVPPTPTVGHGSVPPVPPTAPVPSPVNPPAQPQQGAPIVPTQVSPQNAEPSKVEKGEQNAPPKKKGPW